MLGYVHTYFVCQGGSTHRKAKACGQGVQLFRVNSFLNRK